MDKVTQERIANLHPLLRNEETQIIAKIDQQLIGRAKVRITHGLRTFDEQNKLYAQGRTIKGLKVTNAKAGQSIQNYGFAVDIVLISDGKTASWDTKADWDGDKVADWNECVEVFKANGWDWGGDWKSFKDMPHFEKRGCKWQDRAKKKRDKENYVIL